MIELNSTYGESIGSVTFVKRRHGPAPSMLAASYSAGLIDCSPASQITIDAPAVHALMMTSDGLLHAGSLSHSGGTKCVSNRRSSHSNGDVSKSHVSSALNTPCVGLNSHTHKRLAATIGTMAGM